MISRRRAGLLCVIAAALFSSFITTGTATAAGTIEGEVVDAVSKAGIEEVEVCAYELPEFESFFCVETDADGEYALSAIPDGSYVVEFWAPFLGYATQFYDGVASFEDADEVVVSGGTVPGIDAEMEKDGSIEGRVTDAVTGAGIGGIEVCAFAFGIGGECALTSSFGDYEVAGLTTASYLVEFFDEFQEYETLFYNQQATFEAANPVAVTAPNATTGIDARMSKPGAGVVVASPPPHPPVILPTTIPAKPRPKAVKCHKGFKKVKRHGRKVCVKRHKRHKKHKKKKHRS